MPDPKVFKPHIHLGATGKRESYTRPIQGGTRKTRVPHRNRQQHGQALLAQLQVVTTQQVWWEVWLPVRGNRQAVIHDFKLLAEAVGIQVPDPVLEFSECSVMLAEGNRTQFASSGLLLNTIRATAKYSVTVPCGIRSIPQAGHAVLIEDRVGAHEWNVFDQRLRRQQSVERIFVMGWQRFYKGRMDQLDSQQVEMVRRQFPRKEGCRGFAKVQLLQPDFDGNLPAGGHARRFMVRRVFNQ